MTTTRLSRLCKLGRLYQTGDYKKALELYYQTSPAPQPCLSPTQYQAGASPRPSERRSASIYQRTITGQRVQITKPAAQRAKRVRPQCQGQACANRPTHSPQKDRCDHRCPEALETKPGRPEPAAPKAAPARTQRQLETTEPLPNPKPAAKPKPALLRPKRTREHEKASSQLRVSLLQGAGLSAPAIITT